MTQKEQILVEWLLQNNYVWYDIDAASKVQNNNGFYDEDETDEIGETNSEEIKMSLKKQSNWHKSCTALFAGDLVYFENESFISADDIVESRKNLCEWILKNKIEITDKGISVVHNKDFCKTHKNSDRVSGEHMPRIDAWFSSSRLAEEYQNPRTSMTRISSFIKDSTILIRNASLVIYNRIDSCHNMLKGYLTSLDESPEIFKKIIGESEDVNDKELGKLLYNNSLACKFNEVDDFIYTGEIWMDKQSIMTLDNFPNLVRGNLVIEKSYFLNDYSGFPKRVNGSVYFTDCRYKEFMEFPSGVIIDGNFNFDGQNTQHMLLALAKSDVKIGGNIYCPLYCGTIDNLREIAEEGKWFEEYEKVKQERSVRGDSKHSKHNRRNKSSSENT